MKDFQTSTKCCKFHNEGQSRLFVNWIRAEDSEIFSVSWSENMEKTDDFMLILLPEETMQPPCGEGDGQSSRATDGTSLFLF